MNAECCLDANIFLNVGSSAPVDAPKRARAKDLILNTRFALSAQVLQGHIISGAFVRIETCGINKPILFGTPQRALAKKRTSSFSSINK
jgi:hypothetical protein